MERPQKEHDDVLNRFIKDHENVSEYLDVLENALGFLYEEESFSKIKAIKDFFNRNILAHFQLEEKIIFPAILSNVATPDSKKLISELLMEHKSILKDEEEFKKIISENTFPFDKDTSIKLGLLIRKIIDNLLIHASKEDDNLLPILKRYRYIFER